MLIAYRIIVKKSIKYFAKLVDVAVPVIIQLLFGSSNIAIAFLWWLSFKANLGVIKSTINSDFFARTPVKVMGSSAVYFIITGWTSNGVNSGSYSFHW